LPSWTQLLQDFESQPTDEAKNAWIQNRPVEALRDISTCRDNRHVIFYSSAFLQKPAAENTSITSEDLNGFMTTIHGLDTTRGLTLVMHTPGGVTTAAETIVAYLRSKFSQIEVIVPTFAMSAGTMIALASDHIVMGRQSQLGPIDPQLPIPMTGRFVSARAIVDQFDQAKTEIIDNVTIAHAWAPILQSLGPALLQEARNALEYGERLVRTWLKDYMFASEPRAGAKATKAAKHFNDASIHLSHGRRIDRTEARTQGISVEDLEPGQTLQEAVLTAYNLLTIVFERTPITKVIMNDAGAAWVKSWAAPAGVGR
jgi:hypothetical protein